MRKLLLFILISLILTGCGIIKNNDFKTKCSKNSNSEGFIYNQDIELIFSDDIIKKVIITDEYKATNNIGKNTLKAAKISLEDYIRRSKNIAGFEELNKTDDLDYYNYQYQLDFEIMSDEEVSLFSMTKDYLKQMKVYKEEMTCK